MKRIVALLLIAIIGCGWVANGMPPVKSKTPVKPKPLADVYLDINKILGPPQVRINKTECIQTYNLLLYVCDGSSPLYACIEDYIEDYNDKYKDRYKGDIGPHPLSRIHLYDRYMRRTQVVISAMTGEHNREVRTSEMHFAGVVIHKGHYFLLSDVVATFFKLAMPETKITVERHYVEYDVKKDPKLIRTLPEIDFFRDYKF